ncbi:MAG TPA: DUF4340 domain-containing protein [Candidatus Hydrogenedentes bacterium]|nr:DUF4340 domain-containing protein [Candidatus Hydrogenedentota bacterium]
MKLKQIFFLSVLLLLLCALYVFMGWKERRHAEQALEAGKVFSFEAPAIRELTFHHRGPELVIRGERSAGGLWKITEPNASIAPFQIMWNRVAQHIAALINERSLPADITDLAQYGLEPPVLTLNGTLDSGESFALQLGDIDILERHHYARLNGGNVFLITTEAFFELNRSLLELRHRYLVADREEKIRELEFARIWSGAPAEKEEGEKESGEERTYPEVGEESVLIRVERGTDDAPWKLTSPVDALANYEKVEALSETLQYAVCTEFIDAPENLADYGLDPPKARLSVKDRNSTDWRTLWLGDIDTTPGKEGLFVRVEGEQSIMVADAQLAGLLPRSPLEWRDLRLITRRISDIRKLIYDAPDSRFTLGKDETGRWKLLEPEMDNVNDTAVNAFLQFIKTVAGDAAVDSPDAEQALNNADRTITIEREDDTSSSLALAPHPSDENLWWARQDSGGIIQLTGVGVKMLLCDAETFRSREILRLQKDKVRALTFTLDGQEYRFLQEEGRWKHADLDNTAPLNQSDFDMLLGAISPLQARHILSAAMPEDPAVYGLDAPVFTASITTEDQVISLTIGGISPDNADERFALCSSRPGLFSISQEIMDQLREATRGLRNPV